MALILKLQAKRIALFSRAADEVSEGEELLRSIELDFQIGPLALTSDGDRHRLLAALAQLKSDSGVEEWQVDLIIPTSWGVTHRLPNPGLPEKEMGSHLQWELSKAAIDTEDQYRFNFAFDADDSVILTAVRLRLLEPIEEVLREAGFILRGLFLNGEPWIRINLSEVPGQKVLDVADEGDKAKAGARAKSEEPEEKIEPVLERRVRRKQHPRFFGLVLFLGIIIAAIFVWWKLTSERQPTLQPEPVAVSETEARSEIDSQEIAAQEPLQEEPPSAEQPTESVESVTMLTQRVHILKEALGLFDVQRNLELISFTEDRFLCQLTSADQNLLRSFAHQLELNAQLANSKLTVQPYGRGAFRGVLSANIGVQTSPTEKGTPTEPELLLTAKKHGVKKEALIFSGTKSAILNFLNDLGDQGFSIYRLIFIPWGNQEYRAVLEP